MHEVGMVVVLIEWEIVFSASISRYAHTRLHIHKHTYIKIHIDIHSHKNYSHTHRFDLDIEPIWASLSLYDLRHCKKISETFYFDLNSESNLNMLDSHILKRFVCVCLFICACSYILVFRGTCSENDKSYLFLNFT